MNKFILMCILIFPLAGYSQKMAKPGPMEFNFPYFRLNGERLDHKEAKQEFLKVPGAYKQFKKYRPNLYVGLIAIVSSAIMGRIANNKALKNDRLSLGLYLTTGGLAITSLITVLSAGTNRRNAVRFYNAQFR